MKIAEPKWSQYSKELNQSALDEPQVGDFWLERMFCPYFIIVKADNTKGIYTVLSCLGGAHTVNRKHEPDARIDNKDNTWCFDYSKHMIVDREWIKKAVTYSSIAGFVADVTRSDRNMAVVKEWRQFHAQRLLKELKELGGDVSQMILEADW